jgi:hypothetical protein
VSQRPATDVKGDRAHVHGEKLRRIGATTPEASARLDTEGARATSLEVEVAAAAKCEQLLAPS